MTLAETARPSGSEAADQPQAERDLGAIVPHESTRILPRFLAVGMQRLRCLQLDCSLFQVSDNTRDCL